MALDLSKLEESPQLVDLLIQMEDVLDTLDTYVFPNWFHGEIVSGPEVKRYWLGMILKYPHNRKPDERAAARLIKHGLLVSMMKGSEGHPKNTLSKDIDDEDVETCWLVDIKIPRHLIADLNAGQLDFYDDEIDAEDVQDATDEGMTDETGYVDPTDDVVDDETDAAAAPDPNAPPAAPQGANGQ